MKALSIKQPWANMIASGEKTIETRTWKTEHRGKLLIVSSKEPDIAPAGCALAVVELVDCRPMSVLDEAHARCRKYNGAYSWVLENARELKPFSVRGQPGLFEVEDELVIENLK
ncbi:ASCH domain-containing protein [Crateriforma conspicua]|uniref:ASCH domain-containing protein n=1 Tax=Crateriforma conspicua TaxID=2527996 RepID=UPI00118AA470|nr:ASCH domain-containing protein [Crateriforma conspicua]QDV62471.1 ASCH domain protein [Crateriforma conspicua]